MKKTEFLLIDGHSWAGGESESIDAADTDELPLVDWVRELLDRRLDAFARDGNPGRLASIVLDEIRRRLDQLPERLPAGKSEDDVRRRSVLCLDNSGYETFLKQGVIYVAIPGPRGRNPGVAEGH